MNTKTAEILCNLNTVFYRDNSLSFAQTRQAPWPGWKRAVERIRQDCTEMPERLSVFDLACGNLRFETFFEKEFEDKNIDIYAVDNCYGQDSSVQNLDIMEVILAEKSLNEAIEAPLCDLSVSFGFMHHVPRMEYRQEILRSLVRQAKPSGYVIVSFWQFLNNESLRKKALITHEEAVKRYSGLDLDEGDFLLGWKNLPDTYRYCHSFSETEIDWLVRSVEGEAKLLARYHSDGRGDNLNTYLIFKGDKCG